MIGRRVDVNIRDHVPAEVCRTYATHSWDKYPAKMVPHLARYALERVSSGGDLVFDPFCGCGTVQVEATLSGRNSFGLDINPIAVLLAKAKSAIYDSNALIEYADSSISDAKKRYRKRWASEEGWLSYWFTPSTLKKLLAISTSIDSAQGVPALYRDLLRAALIVATRQCSRADPRSPKPFISSRARELRRAMHFDAFSIFMRTIDRLTCAGRDFMERADPAVSSVTRLGDARSLGRHVRRTLDAVVTSPPYLSAQDYCRSSKLELAVLTRKDDCHLELGRRTLGSGRGAQPEYLWDQVAWFPSALRQLQRVDERSAAVVLRYVNDMKNVFRGINLVLKESGKCCFILGDSMIRGIRLPVHQWVIEIGVASGFGLIAHEADVIRNRRVPPNRRGHSSMIEFEHLLFFERICRQTGKESSVTIEQA